MDDHKTAPLKGEAQGALGPTLAWGVAALLLMAAAWVCWQAPRLMATDMASGPARHRVARWIAGKDPIQLVQWLETRESLLKAVAMAPDNADLRIDLANLYIALGVRRWSDEAGRKDDFTQALEQLRTALTLRPTDGMTWARLALSLHAVGDVGPALYDAWDTGLRYAPADPPVHQVLLETAMAIWPQATPEMQAWVQNFYASAPAPTRKVIERMGALHGLEFALEDAASSPEGVASAPR